MNEVTGSEVVESSTSMIKLDGAVSALAEASTVEDVKHIADVAEAARTYAKAARLGLKAQNKAAEIHLRAQRKAGEMLASMEKNKGGRPEETGNIVLPVCPSLKDLGIDRMQSHRWQRIASVSEEEFEAHLQEIRQADREITTASVLALGRGAAKATRNIINGTSLACDGQWQALIDSGTRFGTIYCGPPWSDERGLRMTVDDLCGLPVKTIVADDAHLHLWTTDSRLFDAKRVMDAWGFEYAGCFVWIKSAANAGNYWGIAHEFLLLGVRGSCLFMDRSLKSWAEFDETHDDRKPEAIRRLIERTSPGPRLELFARQEASGWTMIESQVQSDSEE